MAQVLFSPWLGGEAQANAAGYAAEITGRFLKKGAEKRRPR